MCGITGFCSFNKKSTRQTLVEMTDVIYHRGPDDSGYSFYTNQYANIGLGHRRLSVLDLSTHGHQPMKFENLEIVYNGEVYNFKEIRAELLKLNYTFESDSDTEVILKAYHKWGIKAVDKFNGMFAIAIYDSSMQKLIFIRDRAGIKPFYYYFSNNIFMFSSELKSFHKNSEFKKEINLDSLALFLQFGYILEPYSIFEDTYKLKAGYYLEVDLETKKIDEIKYWDVIDFYNMPKLDLSENEAILKTENILKTAFDYRMVSDVPVGVFLSGGYDSSSVAALIQSDRTQKLKTFTIGFYEEKYNEAHHAKKVADYLGTEHTEYYCTQKEAVDIVPLICEIYDEPFGDVSAIPTILVSKVARKKVTVSLSADGADEIFGGYSRYISNIETKSKIISKLKVLGALNVNKAARYLQHSGIYKDSGLENKFAGFLFDDKIELQKLIVHHSTPASNEKLIKGYKYKKIKTNFNDVYNINTSVDSLDKMFAVDYKTYMIDDVIHKVDRATMSVGLEGREPFLDKNIVEFVSRLPSDMKIKNGDKKWLLKEITHKYLPKDIMDRPKMGFGVPVGEWLKNELREYVEEYLSDKYETVLDSNELIKIKKLFYQGRVNHSFVWNILMFQMWYKKWM